MAIWQNKPSKRTVQIVAVSAVIIVSIAQLSFSRFTPVKNLTLRAAENIAGVVGVAGSVAPNEYNTLAAQFEQKDKALTLREQALAIREQALLSGNDRVTLDVLFGITGLLLVLISLNFYFDWKRGSPTEGVHREDDAARHHNELTTRL